VPDKYPELTWMKGPWTVHRLMEELDVDTPSELIRVLRRKGIRASRLPERVRQALVEGLKAERDGTLAAWRERLARWDEAVRLRKPVSSVWVTHMRYPYEDRPRTRHDLIDYMALSRVSNPCEILEELRESPSLYSLALDACQAYQEGRFQEWMRGEWSPKEVREAHGDSEDPASS